MKQGRVLPDCAGGGRKQQMVQKYTGPYGKVICTHTEHVQNRGSLVR